jgi:NADP-dependent 3-hydroxy acid dehydrogenase YdfG
MDFGLTDKVILITGAAGGMGQAAARLLKTSGAKLVLSDIDAGGLSAIVREIAADGIEAMELQVDVSSAEQTKSIVAAAADKFGRIDGLLHFAGVIDAKARRLAGLPMPRRRAASSR